MGSLVETKNIAFVFKYFEFALFSLNDTFQDPRRPELRGALPIEVIRCLAASWRNS